VRVFVLACGHCGIPESLASAPLGADVTVIWRRALCEAPDSPLPPRVPDAAVLVLVGGNLDAQARIAEDAARAGVHPLRVRFLGGWRLFRDAGALELLARAALARLRSLDVDRAATRQTSRFRGAVPRRWFLSPLTRFRESMPRIEPSRCRAADGCDLCIQSCPEAAIARSVPPVIDAAKCTSCGACLAACPTEAVEDPVQGFEGLAVEASALADGPRLSLAVVCSHGILRPLRAASAFDPTRWRVVEVPSLGALRPLQILRLRAAGFERIVGLSAGRCCSGQANPFLVAAAVLDALGYPGTVAHWDVAGGPPPDAGTPAPPTPVPAGGSLVAFASAHGRLVRVTLPGRGAGIVTVDREKCTLCGLCAPRCWSRALQMDDPDSGIVRLTFDHAACDGCGLCADACPEDAVRLEYGIDTAAAGTRSVVAEDAWVLCSSCGARVAPQRMVARVAAALGQAARLDLCPECKSSRLFESVRAA